VGARLRALDDQANQNESYLISMQTTLSEVKDLDYAEAIRSNLKFPLHLASGKCISRIKCRCFRKCARKNIFAVGYLKLLREKRGIKCLTKKVY
jgi:hypothetical protein